MPTATPDDREPDQSAHRSRLDQEIDEILSKTSADSLPPPSRRPSLRAMPGGRPQPRPIPRLRGASGAFWMGAALVIAFVAFLVADASPLLANILAVVALVCFVMPVIQRFRRPKQVPEAKMWRGQVIDDRPRQSNPLDDIRAWWDRRRPR